ncbi:MAG: rRNA cytosine-C5-methyltransferase [Bacteroidales bacterium]|nr:rRNA cytosine-C5-methyltransferase [Bacteroidales bacterium]MDD4030443.1 rRNA cytosine-C5-methyltransferase [Bacteroidales bacterium]MDD4435408.1 rRNA cytosine-C5-methyltransferase [Bacteroidales bacterium]
MTDFRNMMEAALLPGEVSPLLAALESTPPVSIRQHIRKAPGELFPGSDPVPWCPTGRYLEERPVFTLDPRFHAGAYYVQEASGMSLWQLAPYLSAITSPRVLDACAAPGGKSTLLLDILPQNGLLVSNEVIRTRVPILAENLARWGYGNVVVTQNDPADLGRLTEYFDVVVADVPCSGEGLFRKEPESRKKWSPAVVALCVSRQRRILSDLWPCLRQGGLLLYSTCTFNRMEDEEQVDWIRDHLGARLLLGPEKYLPHRIRGEGFFMALLEKTGTCHTGPGKSLPPGGGKKGGSPSRVPADAPQHLEGPYSWYMKGPFLKAFPQELIPQAELLESMLNVFHSGIAVATKKGKDWVPRADLALALDLKKEAYPVFRVNREQAVAFLRRDPLVFPDGTERGYLLLTYNDLPLGFVKNLGMRSNNLHPVSRRIFLSLKPSDH